MNTLTVSGVAQVLNILHKEAEVIGQDHIAANIGQINVEDNNLVHTSPRWLADEETISQTIYQDYSLNLSTISQVYGRFLYMIARNCWAKRIVEFGTSTGISTIYFAAALRDNGGGQLISSELEPANAARTRTNIEAAGLADLVEIREGDTINTLRDVGSDVDILLLNGACPLYLPVLRFVEPFMNRGAAIMGRNAFDPAYLDYVRDPLNGYFSQPLEIDNGCASEFAIRTL
ncbi:methyltransferase [Acetobacter sp. DmW_043]|uniref:O-methyltransferase n=1 Tax=Acetobacter sp. DmW_043 TaxID=1670658 RepID=UPI000A3C4AF2|nr:class I SAM-dependent methyltransferase [Acetobacter sp. DmW_043]OUI87643.1 methyltransferase [Acetobacter sp. DmW_043]